jgi:hypothetical protein
VRPALRRAAAAAAGDPSARVPSSGNGFHVSFSAHSSPAYILPEWLSPPFRPEPENPALTTIILPLRDEVRRLRLCRPCRRRRRHARRSQAHSTEVLEPRFDELDPSLLLFLHRVRCLEVCFNLPEAQYRRRMLRRELGGPITEIVTGPRKYRWVVHR